MATCGVRLRVMSNTLRSFKRRQDRALEEELPIDQQKLPVARVLTEPVRGPHVSFPLLAWTALRERDRIPLVMLVLALLSPDKEGICGTLEVELPVYPETEAATLLVLERYGWAGDVWTLGAPPPFDNIELGEQLKGLLNQTTTRMQRTLVFAPDPETGSALAQTVDVARAKGRFLMPPLEAPKEPPNAERLKSLRDLIAGCASFFQAERAIVG